MTTTELLERLHDLHRAEERDLEDRFKYTDVIDSDGRPIMGGDHEVIHIEADEALLTFIDDDAVRAAYEALLRWHA
jgi:hypothetical protein